MKIKLLLIFFFYSAGAQAMNLPCPANMVGPDNLLSFNLNAGSGSSKIEGPATLHFDECRVELTEEAIVPIMKFRVKTDAFFKFKKKILFANVKKTIPLRCSFKSTVKTHILDSCQVSDTLFSFYRLNCRGIPKVFTKLIEKLIKREIRKKGENLLQDLLFKLAEKDEIFESMCSDA